MRALLLWLASCLVLAAGERRIASYSPGATQTLVDLGCAEEVVMATRWCPLPKDHPAARDADLFRPDLEKLLQAKPSLVILPRTANPLWPRKCAEAGLRVVLLHAEARDSAGEDIRTIGEAVGRAKAADELAAALTMKRPGPRRKAAVIWDGVIAGPSSYLAGPLEAAGLTTSLTQGSWVRFDWELLAASRPDLVIWVHDSPLDESTKPSSGKIAEMGKIPVVRDLECVRNGRIFEAKSGHNWLPGSGLKNIIPELSELSRAPDPKRGE